MPSTGVRSIPWLRIVPSITSAPCSASLTSAEHVIKQAFAVQAHLLAEAEQNIPRPLAYLQEILLEPAISLLCGVVRPDCVDNGVRASDE